MFLLGAAVGLLGMSPSVNFGDSGEFIAAGATLSIPHAPGYPLYCLVVHAAALLFGWGNWGYRVNLSSVLCAAGALAALWLALRAAGIPRLAAWFGILCLGASPLWLHTSLQAEVFGLNGLLAACALWAACSAEGSLFAPRPMAALGLCLGLGGGNHQMLIFIVPALAAEAWRRAPDPRAAARGLAWFAGFGLIGLSVYLYLPLRARAFPPLDWDHPADPAGFLRILLRRDYGSFALTVDGAAPSRISSLAAQTARYLRQTWSGFGFPGVLLGIAGLVFWDSGGLRIGRRLPVLWILLSGPGFLFLGNPPFNPLTEGALGRFYLLSWLGCAVAAAAGAAAVQRRWPRAAGSLLAAPLLFGAVGSGAWAQRTEFAPYDYGCNLLASLPRGSLLYIDGGDDTFYTLAYLQFAQGRRPDVEIHDRGGLVFHNPYGADFRSLSKEEKERRRQAVESSSASGRPMFYSTLRDSILPGMGLIPWGLLRRAGPDGGPGAGYLWELYPRRFSRAAARAHYRYRALVPVYAALRAADPGDAAPLRHLQLALADGPDVDWISGAVSARAQWLGFRAAQKQDWPAAEEAYRFALRGDARNGGSWGNLAVALEREKKWEEAERAYLQAAALPGDPFTAWRNLGAFYWARGRWDGSAEMFARALKVRPGDADTARYLQAALSRRGSR